VSTAQTVLLGAIAGVTIFLGLPIARMRSASAPLKTFLNGLSAGILVFLLVEILAQSGEAVEHALEEASEGQAAWGTFAGLAIVYVLGVGVGLLSLLFTSRLWRRRPLPTGEPGMGPGAMALAEARANQIDALRLGMSIAVGIGLHNFSEGLAIGQAANAGDISLAILLVVGFAAHNATEGFGIAGPLAAADVRASWGWLALAGLIGGGPTFLGTVVGTAVTSIYVFVAFLALAGGAILYVVGELFAAGRRLSWPVTLWGIFIGILAGFGTELIIEAAGG
jgi:ZIP family zinc transporter